MSDKRTALEYPIELDVKHGYRIRAQAELAALREIARLARIIRQRYPGLLAVMWEDDNRRELPYMREKLDAAFANVDRKVATK